MSTHKSKALIIRVYEEGMNRKDMRIIYEVFAPDYVAHFPGVPPIRGIDAAKQLIGTFLAVFPDIQFKIEDQVAEGDKVATRWTARGTHRGEFRGFPPKVKGIPPSGKQVSFTATDIYRIAGGRIMEEWNTLEQLDVLHQIGALPAPE